MAKKTDTNIVEVWNWLISIFETGKLSAVEQIVFVHIVAAINRNLWRHTVFNTKIIAAATGKDNRTVKKAISKLIELGYLTDDERGFYIVKAKSTLPDNTQNFKRVPELNTGTINSSEQSAAADGHQDSQRRIFNA